MFLNCPNLDQWHKGVPRSARTATIAGFAVLIICGVGFGSWAAVAPLEGAVVAQGTFVATGQNKQVQHLEGGIIEEVLVREGDTVKAGQVLVRLDQTNAQARMRRLQLRAYRLAISRSRLEAQIDGRDELAIPKELEAVADVPEIASMLSRQRIELRVRREKLESEQKVLRKEIAGLRESITGYDVQVQSMKDRLELFNEELVAKKVLYKRELARKSDLLALQRAEAALHGELGQLTGRTADARERIARAEQQIASLRSVANQQSVEELRQVESELDDVDEQLRAARDVLRRTQIQAPVRGAVVKINHHTPGGVVGPGDVLLELLPLNDELIIEARVSPSEVSQVKAGQQAQVRLTALNQRITPMVSGKVVYLSADAVPDQSSYLGAASQARRGDSFVVRVELDPQDRVIKSGDFRATPGMPADVYIKTAKRTFFEYIMRPVLDSFARAFRER